MDLTDARALADAANKACDQYPRRGVDGHGNPVGPETYSEGAYGWTARAVEPEPVEVVLDEETRKTTVLSWAVGITDEVREAAVRAERTGKLSVADRAVLAAAIDAEDAKLLAAKVEG